MPLDEKGNKKNTKTTLKQNLLTSSQGKLSNGVKNWHDLTLPNFAHLRGKITFHHAVCAIKLQKKCYLKLLSSWVHS